MSIHQYILQYIFGKISEKKKVKKENQTKNKQTTTTNKQR